MRECAPSAPMMRSNGSSDIGSASDSMLEG